MIWDSFLRLLTDLGWLVGVWLAVALAVRIVQAVHRRVSASRLAWRLRRRREGRGTPEAPAPFPAPAPETAAPPEWSGALIVRADGDRLVPSIQLRGPPFPAPARVRLDLMDESSIWRRMSEREVSDPDLGTEVPLPPFRVPEGLDVDEIVGWVWKVVLEVGARAHVLSWQVLRPMAGLNREAELGERGEAAV